MKNKILFGVAWTLMSSVSFAQYFPANPLIQIYPGQISAQVYNPYYEPIVCNGQVFGQTSVGPVVNQFFLEQVLGPGDYRVAFVQTTPFAPFVSGWANINCRFLRFY